MIDFRHKTFLVLCKIKNFTKAADELCITQPAVSQHIKYLEDFYGGELIFFEGKKFLLTNRGKKLYAFVLTVSADCQRIQNEVCSFSNEKSRLNFGATLSIGEYLMPHVLKKILGKKPNVSLTMEVNNTQVLLQKLKDGKLDFILIEGFFDKSKYDSMLFSLEKFCVVCAPCVFEERNFSFEELFQHRLIIREKGSGTRRVLEQILEERNFNLDSFKSVCEIGSMDVIKQLVLDAQGITFLYKIAAQKELQLGSLVEIPLKEVSIEREFNFVFLRGTQFSSKYIECFNQFKNAYTER